jgi:hypothetical protein
MRVRSRFIANVFRSFLFAQVKDDDSGGDVASGF